MRRTTSIFTAVTLAAALPAFAANQPGAHFIENWDLDENGSVSIEEAKERRGDIFTTFDTNEDGILSAEDYVMFDEAREADMKENGIGMGGNGQGKGQGGQGKGQGQGQGMGEHGAAMSMTRENADLNGDGDVTRDEFIAGVDAWFEKQDRNGDGILTTDDFGPRK